MAQQNSNTTMSSLTETPIKRTADSLENDSSPVQVKKARKYEYTHSTFNSLHYKNRTTVNLKVSTDVNGQKNYRVVDGNGREFKMLLPPSQVEWPKLAEGGNYDPKSLYSNTEATANLEVTWASNANTQFEGAQNDFLKMNAEQDKFLMRALFESSARREKIIAEVEKACAGKDLPSDKIEDKAFSKFLRKANSNVKQIKDPSTKKVTGHTIKISRKAYMFPQGPEAPAVPVQTTFYNKSYKVYPQPPKVGNGDTLGVVVRKYVYDGEKGYGIKYMLVPDAVVVYAKSKGLKDASRYDIMGRQATFELKTRRGRKVVYVNDASLNYFIRPPASIAMYADMTEEAIADSAARGGYDPAYSITLKEDDNNKEFFDTCQQIVTDYNQWVWDNADLLPKTKEDILDEVREDLEDADETTIQATARERFATVKTKDQEGYTFCSIKTDETGLRNIKLKAKVNDWTPKPTIKDCTEETSLSEGYGIDRGDKVRPVIKVTAYVMSTGKYGVGFALELKDPIEVHASGADGGQDADEMMPEYHFSDSDDE